MSDKGWEQKYIKEAFDTNWVVPLGPNVNAFEHDLEEFVNGNGNGNENGNVNGNGNGNENENGNGNGNGEGVSNTNLTNNTNGLAKRVVALSAGTAAVHLGLLACGVGPGDEVIVQSFTFCASSHPITYLGATPVFVDSERETWNMDPALMEVAIKDRIAKTGKKPKAIVPVALYGMPYRIDEIMEIANRYGIPVIEDAAEGFGSRYNGQVLGTFGDYGVLSFNGNKMITTSGGGALICPDKEAWQRVMWLATQARESYPYYQHEAIGYNYRMSNICAGIGRGQMTIVKDHIAHHKHVQRLYEELLKDVKGIQVHSQPSLTPCPSPEGKGSVPVYDSNYWLCTITIDPEVKIKGQENAYKSIITGAVGGAAGVIHAADTAITDCQPNDNVEALRVALDAAGIEARPVWKPMHKQPVYKNAPAYVNGVSEDIFKIGMCLPAGPYVTDDDVKYIVETIKKNT
jgi:dTDP-4-amino-4,6-dideoxygalactose transaminase